MSRGLRVVQIDDLEVNFPFEPYDIQKHLMSKVVECIKTKSNGLLESPTGTGKTLSLLCAALSWQLKEKQSYRTMLKSVDVQLPLQSSHAVKAAFEPPKIIYASRTHSQLSQAVLELKRSHYRNAKAVVLGSRDILCIHEEVQRIPNSSGKIMACHAKIQRHICAYHNNVQQKKEESAVKEATVVDIEDIVQKGKQGRFCPFFMSRELVKDADIVFMPYNYILDPKIRSSHGIDLNNSVIILDEGHNIPKLCEEAVSFEIKSSLIAMCISELTKAMNEFKEQGEGERAPMGQLRELTLPCIVRLKQIFLSLEAELDKVEGKSTGYLLPGEGFLEILSRSGFTTQTIPRLTAELDMVGTFLTGTNAEATGCDKFGSILRVLSSNSHQKTFSDSYKVYVELEIRKDGRRDFRVKDDKPAKVFNFWCFNPSVGLETLSRFGPRSIILSSGTLSPIPFLQQELLLPFPVQLSNPHIIKDNQLFVGVFKHGPGNVPLSSSYENRDKKEYLADLGESILKICSVVPGGVLVFFPSYASMDSCVKPWRESGVMNSIQQFKKVLVEPRGSEALKQVLVDYYAAVRGGGGCLMAVCRGKVSEGLDFTDDFGRAVILTGIPYSPAMDPKVLAKKQYLDEKVRSGSDSNINGRKWYQLDATRALNQAVGRIIRHAHDYGAILFCDGRCDDFGFKLNISQWVSKRLKSYSKFSEGLTDLAHFFGSSLQKERTVSQTQFLEKQIQDVEVDFAKFQTKSNSFMFDTTDEQLLDVYSLSSERQSQFVSNGKSSASSSGGNQCSKKSSSTFFEDLAACPIQKQPEFNFVVPAYSPVPLLPPRKTAAKIFEQGNNPRKRIKITKTVGKFSTAETRERMIKEGRQAAAELTLFPSTSEFWQWVKLTLSRDNYSKFIRAIKKFRGNEDAAELAEEVGSSFKVQFIPQCLQGMSLFLTLKQLEQVKTKLTIPL